MNTKPISAVSKSKKTVAFFAHLVICARLVFPWAVFGICTTVIFVFVLSTYTADLPFTETLSPNAPTSWPIPVPPDWPDPDEQYINLRRGGHTLRLESYYTDYNLFKDTTSVTQSHTVYVLRYGWPVVCAEWSMYTLDSNDYISFDRTTLDYTNAIFKTGSIFEVCHGKRTGPSLQRYIGWGYF